MLSFNNQTLKITHAEAPVLKRFKKLVANPILFLFYTKAGNISFEDMTSLIWHFNKES